MNIMVIVYFIIFLLFLVVIGVNTHETISFRHYSECPEPYNRYKPFKIGETCKINKSYWLLDAPKSCCKNIKEEVPTSDCFPGTKCGLCKLHTASVRLQGSRYGPYKRFATYCYPDTLFALDDNEYSWTYPIN